MDGSTHWLGVLASLNVPHIAVYGMELLVKQQIDWGFNVEWGR